VKSFGVNTVLLLHTSVLVIKKKIRTRVFELQDLIGMLLREKGSLLLHHFINLNFAISLAYLAHAFGILNFLNISCRVQK
jgi:hypothetical protein